jgi:hypothetical protein
MEQEPQLDDLIGYVVAQQPAADPLDQLSTAVGISTRLDQLADDLLGYFVDVARLAGASWTEIGQHMGVTKQAVQKRFVPKQDADTDFLTKRRLRRFTDRARRVTQQAKMEAERRGDAEVRNEHVVLGLLTEPDGLAARAMVAVGAPLDRVGQAMVGALGADSEPTRGRVRFSSGAKKTLELALREALALGHKLHRDRAHPAGPAAQRDRFRRQGARRTGGDPRPRRGVGLGRTFRRTCVSPPRLGLDQCGAGTARRVDGRRLSLLLA